MKPMYEPSDLAAMDPLVLMKNLDHVRMSSRRLSYILQQQVHLYTPTANELRDRIESYVGAEHQIEDEMARRQLRARRRHRPRAWPQARSTERVLSAPQPMWNGDVAVAGRPARLAQLSGPLQRMRPQAAGSRVSPPLRRRHPRQAP